MSFRLSALLLATFTMVVALLGAAPAQAAPAVSIGTPVVAMSSGGTGKVWIRCHAKKTCSGALWARGHVAHKTKFKVAGKKARFVTLKYPAWKSLSADANGVRKAELHATRATARVRNLEPIRKATIAGTVVSRGGPEIQDVQVHLWKKGSRGRMTSIARRDIGGDRTFSFQVPTGMNNSTTAAYQLQLSGKQNGTRRTWWWRGANGRKWAGGLHSDQGSAIKVTRADKLTWKTDFEYSSIKGVVTKAGKPVSSREVTVYARPITWPKSSAGMRNLDVTSCADIVGRVKTNSSGQYELGFVPASHDRQLFMVKSEKSLWNNKQGHCHAAVRHRHPKYAHSTPGLLRVGAGATTMNLSEDTSGTAVTLKVKGYQGNTTSAATDRWVTVREYAKGRQVLASDIVYQGTSRSARLGQGWYWFETGRRLGCSKTYNSRFKDNSGYLKGLERGHEARKAKNYKMHREHCRSYAAGAYRKVYVSGSGKQTVTLTNTKGAKVTGRLTARTTRTRTEVLIRLTKTNGRTVYRTGMTNSAGKFSVSGLAPGTYKVSVNADSWRGIGRSFSGTKKVKVRSGQSKSIGTLKFK